MPKRRPPYSPEFRCRMVELVRAGRSPEDLAREFEPTAQFIGNWVAQADKQEGRREEAAPGLSASERDELARLRREARQLRVQRDILSKAAACARETGTLPGLPGHEREPGLFPRWSPWRACSACPRRASTPGCTARPPIPFPMRRC